MKHLSFFFCISIFFQIPTSYANYKETYKLTEVTKNVSSSQQATTFFTQKITPLQSTNLSRKEHSRTSIPPAIQETKIMKEYDKEDTEEINGLIYHKNSTTTLTGIVLEYQHSLLVSRVHSKNGLFHGTAHYFYPDKTLQKEEFFLNGKLHGIRKTFSLYGIITEQGYYQNGQKHGTFSYYFPNGILREEVSFIADRKEGISTLYHQNTKSKEISQYSNNLLTGEQKEFNQQGILIRTTPHEKGRRHGIEKHYIKNSLSKEIPYMDDLRHGKALIFRENGTDVSITVTYTRGAIFSAFCHPSHNAKRIRISEEEIYLWQEEDIVPSCP
ncbi:MAG: toxin-antitoxin system YwqK family antitoxin [Desulfovibrionaceae bacterium]